MNSTTKATYTFKEIANVKHMQNFPDSLPKYPLLIKNGMKDWKIMDSCSLDILTDLCGYEQVLVSRCKDSNDKIEILFRDYVTYIYTTTDKDPYYLTNWTVKGELTKFLKLIEPPLIFFDWFELIDTTDIPPLKWFLIGPKNSYSPFHTDVLNTSAWNGLVHGEKEWILIPPKEESNTSSFGNLDTNEKVPQNSMPLTCSQRSGDVMFVPSGWVHKVTNKSTTIAISCNFLNHTNAKLVYHFLMNNNKYDWANLLVELVNIAQLR